MSRTPEAKGFRAREAGASGYRGVSGPSTAARIPSFRFRMRWMEKAGFQSSLSAAIAHDIAALEVIGPDAPTNYPAAAYGIGEWK